MKYIINYQTEVTPGSGVPLRKNHLFSRQFFVTVVHTVQQLALTQLGVRLGQRAATVDAKMTR